MRKLYIDNYNQEFLKYIFSLFGKYPQIKVNSFDYKYLEEISCRKAALVWLLQNKMYQLPTKELVEWLKPHIENKLAIEICAGHGWLGESLGIHSTDGFIFEKPELGLAAILVHNQYCIPMPRVEKLMAIDAVKKYLPEVVIGCFATHKYEVGMTDGSIYGVDDDEIFNIHSVKKYILIGAESIHGHRPFLQRKHTVTTAPWLMGRGENPKIWIWEK